MTRIEPTHTNAVQEPKSRKEAQGVRAKFVDFSTIFAQLSAGVVRNSARNGTRVLAFGHQAQSQAGRRTAQQSDPRAALRAPATKSLRPLYTEAGQASAKEMLTQSRRNSANTQLRERTVHGYGQRQEMIDRGAAANRLGSRGSHDRQAGDGPDVHKTPGAEQAARAQSDAQKSQQSVGQGDGSQTGVAESGAVPAGDAAALGGAKTASQSGSVQSVGRIGATGPLLTNGGGGASQMLSSAAAGGQADGQGSRSGLGSAGASKQAGMLRGEETPEIFKTQLMHGLGAALRKGRGAVTLRLRPNSLGELTIRLRMNGDSVEVKIDATTDQARQLLEHSKDSLRSALEARGLHARRIEIVLERSRSQGLGHRASETHSQGEPGQPGANEFGAGGGDKPAAGQQNGTGNPVGAGAEIQTDAGKNFDGEVELEVELPGIVYGVADGAARVVRVDALA